MNNVNKILKIARMKKGYSQERVARLLGYSSPQFISNFERGECLLPLVKLKKMGEILGVDKHQIVRNLVLDYTGELYKAFGIK